MRKFSQLILLVLIISLCSQALAAEKYTFNQRQQSQRYYRLLHEFRCLVCQNEDLADSDADLAEDLRQQIYIMLRQGLSDRDIKKYMVARYSNFILFRPPLIMPTLVLWFAPLFILLIALYFLYKVIKQRNNYYEGLSLEGKNE